MGIPEWEEERPSVEESMSGFGVPYTPYHVPDPRELTKQDVANVVATHIGFEFMNAVAHEIGVRHTVPRMAAHHGGSLAAARAQTARPSLARGVRLVATHVPLPAYLVMGTAAVAMGYGATHGQHGGTVPGVTGFGGVGPGHYETASRSDPFVRAILRNM